jgi:glycosyltransferase involved in cell wall biosynthesis
MISNNVETRRPFFSIGVTTYNRKELLKHTLNSLLDQDFKDFEVIVGNDYLAEPLTFETIGINDSRIRIINNDHNLGELENMNSLLSLARGKYFSWIFDDDLCSPGFLSKTYEALVKFNFPGCVFSSFFYIYGKSNVYHNKILKNDLSLYAGKEFLRLYLSGSIRALGLGGFHDINYLNRVGGVSKLSGSRMALYSEYFLIFQDGLLENVAYIKSELVGNRVHQDSFSSKSTDIELFKEAGLNLFRKSIIIFADPYLINDFEKNLKSLLKSVISVVITKNRAAGSRITSGEIAEYLDHFSLEFETINDQVIQVLAKKCLKSVKKEIVLFRIKAYLKRILPLKYLKLAHIILSNISKYTNKSF